MPPSGPAGIFILATVILPRALRDRDVKGIPPGAPVITSNGKAAWEALGKALQAAGKHDEAIKVSDHVADLDSLFFKLKYVAPRR